MARKVPFRKEKIADRIQKEVSEYIRCSTNTSTLSYVSIIRIDLRRDYSHAKIYWDTYNKSVRGEVAKSLDTMRGKIRKHLSGKLNLYSVPSLDFHYDEQYEAEIKITNLLNSL